MKNCLWDVPRHLPMTAGIESSPVRDPVKD